MKTRRLFRHFLISVLALTAAACSSTSEHEKRIVAIGDLHGDLEATRAAFRLAGAIDEQDHWVGGTMIVVQTGDQLDRGDDEQAILDLFESLKMEADAAGGAFYPLLGNHELMNVKGDLRYVTEGGFQDFEDAVEYDPADTLLAAYEPHQRARMAALLPGRPYARLLAERSLILQVGENVFVHGGALPEHVQYGIDRINEETRAWLRGERERPEILNGSNSPQWTRLYSDQPDSVSCAVLHQVLDSLDAARIIVSHTVQEEGITSYCDGGVWCIDVGMAAAYGGPVEVLEIQGDSIRVLRRGLHAAATFAGGCFWCIEAPFEKVPGVADAVSGYTGGTVVNPTYGQVGSGATGHTEAVQVHYDPSVVSYEQLLDFFLRQFDPTDGGGSFVDRGSQYRPGIFYHDEEQRAVAEEFLRRQEESGRFEKPIATPILALDVFYEAEEYHQDFYKKDPQRYNSYRRGSGRDRYLDQVWGDEREPAWLRDLKKPE